MPPPVCSVGVRHAGFRCHAKTLRRKVSHAGGCLLRGSAPLRESAFLKLGTLDFEGVTQRREGAK
jgi:hypothetical protein